MFFFSDLSEIIFFASVNVIRVRMILIIHMLQTGLKLVSDSAEEDFLVALLVSLSKLSSKSTVLISEQVPFSNTLCCLLCCCCWKGMMHICADQLFYFILTL